MRSDDNIMRRAINTLNTLPFTVYRISRGFTFSLEVRAAIEARAKERLAQQAAQEKFFHALLLLKLERKEPNGEASSALRQLARNPSASLHALRIPCRPHTTRRRRVRLCRRRLVAPVSSSEF